jgi:hypothetical protein
MVMQLVRVVGAVVGVVLAIVTSMSVMRTLVVPGGRAGRLMRVSDRATSKAFRALAAGIGDYRRRNALLALHAPLILATMLGVWLIAYLLAFGLMLWPADGSFATSLREAGSSLLTLGFASTRAGEPTVVDFLAGATGLIVVALQIAYLPTLYSSYNRRETEVTLVGVRAGRPAWGPELLARSRWAITTSELPDFFRQWERWAADVSESHTSYPILIRFRSQDVLANWIIALLAVMDGAALYNAVAPSEAPIQARLALQMGFVCMRQLADTIGMAFDPDPKPDGPLKLTFEEFEQGVDRLRAVSFPMERTTEEAWIHFRGWRVNYEDIVYRIAYEIDAPPALWSGPRRGGLIAKAPVRPPNRRPEDPEGLSVQPPPAARRS